MISRIAIAAFALAISTQGVQAQVAQHHAQSQDTTHMMGRMHQGVMAPGMMGRGMMGQGMAMEMMNGMDRMGMMMAGMPSPAMILGAAQSLDLTGAQKTRLETLQKQLTESVQPEMQKAMAAHHRAMQALEGDQPDIDAYEAALKDAMNQMVLVRVAVAKTNVQARDVLTADQRSKVSEASSMMWGMMGSMMHGMPHAMMDQHRGMHAKGGMPGR